MRLLAPLVEGSRRFRNRNEREFAGYRDAIDELVRQESPERTVRLVLAELREEGKIEAEGAGRGARWRRLS